MKTKITLFIISNLLFVVFSAILINEKNIVIPNLKEPNVDVIVPLQVDITNERPSYLNYEKLVSQLRNWNTEAPELTEVSVYGKSTNNKDLVYIRINNNRIKSDKPKILITACIHGNEPCSTATTMWYIGYLLKNYSKDIEIRKLIDSRDIYFVPVVSPDSYPNKRIVDGVDPNRDFPGLSNPNHRSVKPVASLQDLFLKISPQAVMSCHTYGRVYLMPYGDVVKNCPDHDSFKKVLREMSNLSGYRNIRACDLYMSNGKPNSPPMKVYGRPRKGYNVLMPIYGTEVDWYYRNQALSNIQNGKVHQGAFSIVMEMGTHQRIPSIQDIKTEFSMTLSAFLYFIKEAPLVDIWWDNNGNRISRDGDQFLN